MQNRIALKNFILQVVSISNTDAEEIANSFEYIEIKKGALLLKEKEISDHYMFLEKGLMRTFLYDLDGNEITTDFFTANQIVFEVTSFFNRIPSEANIQAITDCSGLTISYQTLNTLFHEKPAFRDFGRAMLVKKFIASQKRNYGMINRTAEERYQNIITTKPQILQHAPLKYIASYIGVTDSTLSRLRKKIE